MGTTKLRVRIVVPQLHESVIPVTKKDVRLGSPIVPNVPTSAQITRVTSYIIELRSRALQNILLYSSANFVMQSFQAFTHYDHIKTLNMAFLSRQQMSIWMTSSTNRKLRVSKRSCIPVNISWWFLNLPGRNTKF